MLFMNLHLLAEIPVWDRSGSARAVKREVNRSEETRRRKKKATWGPIDFSGL